MHFTFQKRGPFARVEAFITVTFKNRAFDKGEGDVKYVMRDNVL